jgi:hypothetical protein
VKLQTLPLYDSRFRFEKVEQQHALIADAVDKEAIGDPEQEKPGHGRAFLYSIKTSSST